MDDSVAIIIVVYNCKLRDSASYRKASHYKEKLLIVVIDNSNDPEILSWNQEEGQREKIVYLTYGCNLGLSKAYNLGIQFIKNKFNHIKWMITADQDTVFDDRYFEKVFEKALEVHSNTIFYPDVYAENKKLSPSSLSHYYVNGLQAKIIAINSGLLFSIELFHQLKYEEKLFLDMIDYDLFCQLYLLKLDDCIKPLNVKVTQNFSGRTINGNKNDYHRFKIYAADYNKFCKKWNVNTCYKYFILLKRAVKLTFYYKNISYLGFLLSNEFRKVSVDKDDSED